jgi:ribosomal protein S18 acetylase RimI-like enzyme
MLRQVTSAVPDRICLQVLQDNPAQKLYQRHGFETHDIRDGRLLMELR